MQQAGSFTEETGWLQTGSAPNNKAEAYGSELPATWQECERGWALPAGGTGEAG